MTSWDDYPVFHKSLTACHFRETNRYHHQFIRPSLTSSDGVNNKLDDDLNALLTTVQKAGKSIVLVAFHVRVGTDQAAWEVSGPHGLDVCSDNGLLFWKTSTEHSLLPIIAFCPPSTLENTTPVQPCPRRWQLLDYVFVWMRD
nr:unnamed protein product [Spirometra erinaceieuropaei]